MLDGQAWEAEIGGNQTDDSVKNAFEFGFSNPTVASLMLGRALIGFGVAIAFIAGRGGLRFL